MSLVVTHECNTIQLGLDLSKNKSTRPLLHASIDLDEIYLFIH